MKQITNSTPILDGFRMPQETEKHKSTFMIWPERTDNWRNGAIPAQKVFAQVANTIVKYEPVVMIVSNLKFDIARSLLDPKVKLVEMTNDDSWMRDCGPTWLVNKTNETRMVDWIFNAWGGLDGGLYFPWANDDKIARKVANLTRDDYYRTDFVLEGGAIHSDGVGTIYTTEECLLNKNRNPHLSKIEIEQNLKDYLGAKKIIWLPLGVYLDETDGHVDNMIHIVEPGHVVLTWTDDKNDPQYERSLLALNVLENEVDAVGNKIKVTKLYQPDPMYFTQEESEGIDSSDGMGREIGHRLAASYANYYICNGAVIMPIFNQLENDQKAIETLKKLYPNRVIEPIYTREILLGGGNIHCITQNEM